MSATLPTTWGAGHEPTGTEFAQVLNAVSRLSNIYLINSGTSGVAWTVSGGSSATYADITNGTWTYTKLGDSSSSNLIVFAMGGWRANTSAPTSIAIAANINSVDTFLGLYECSLAGNLTQHLPVMGMTQISSVPAGTYTMKIRYKRNGGSGTITIDGTDSWSVVVAEVPL